MKNNVKRSRLMHAANYLKKNNPVILKGQPIGASRALKYAWWFESFRDQLRNGVYRFSYFKKDGSIREACGTLNPAFIPAEHLPKDYNLSQRVLACVFFYSKKEQATKKTQAKTAKEKRSKRENHAGGI